MAKKTGSRPLSGPARQRRLAAAAKGGRIVVGLARGTLLAAGLAVAHLVIPETDSRFHLFDPTLLDRLHSPISRYHE